MADTIARIKLDSGEFDSKIKRAVTGLRQMEEECREVGGTLAILEKDQLDYVKALGQMQTVATTTKGKLAELTSAYTELRVQYNHLTDEEKKGDFGKALNSSLAQLKTRIDDTKKELNDVSRELGNTSQASEGTGSAVDGLTSILGKNITQLVGWGTAIAAAKAALDIAKDAFFATESSIDEWGRSLEGAKGAYNVFLDTLNNGNWSGFFQNLTTAIQGARDLYDSLDRLGSVKSNNEAAIAITQRAIAQLRKRKQDGEDVDDQIMQQSNKLAALQNQAVVQGEKAGRDTMYQTIRNSINSIGGAKVGDASINAAIEGLLNEGQPQFDKYAQTVKKFENWSKAQRTVTKSDMDGNSWQTQQFDINLLTKEQQRQYKIAKAITDKETEIQKGINIFAQAVNEGTSNSREQFKNTRYALQGSGGGGGSSVKAAAVTTKLTEEEKEAARQAKALAEAEKKRAEQLNKLREEGVNAVRNNDLKSAFAVQKKAQEGGYMGDTSIPLSFTMTQDNVSALIGELKTQIGQSDIGSDMYNALTEQLNDVTSLSSLINYAMKNGIDGAELADVSQTLWQQLLGGGDIPDEALQSFKDSIGEALGKSLEFDSEGNVKEEKKSSEDDAWKGFQRSISQLSGVMSGVSTIGSGLQAMGIKLDEDFSNFLKGIQGAISVVQGVISIINALSVPSENLNTVATNLNTTALGTLAASINSNTFSRWIKPWATGGIVHAAMGVTVPGNRYSGDLVPAMVNSGELILNKAQQGNLAAQLEGGGAMQNLHLETKISAEDIRFILSAASSRQNNTEYLNFDFV